MDELRVHEEKLRTKLSAAILPRVTKTSVLLAREANPRLFYLSVGLSLLNAALLLAQVLLGRSAIAVILQENGGHGSVSAVLPALLGLLASAALATLATSALVQIQRLLGEHVQRMMWDRILGVTTTVPLEQFEDPAFFDTVQRVRANAIIRPLAMSQGVVQLWSGFAALVVLGATLIVIQPFLVAILVIGGLPLAWLTRAGGRLEFAFAVEQTPSVRRRLYLTETMIGRSEAKEIRAFNLAAVLHSRLDAVYDGFLSSYAVLARGRFLQAAGAAVVTTTVTAAAIVLLLRSAFEHSIPLASVGAALIAVRLMAARTQQVFAGAGAIFESSLFLRDFHEFVGRAATENHPLPGATQNGRFREIVVEDLSFRYPGSGADALEQVSLTIRAGETIALVGANGSGKTTLAKIIGGMYTPSSGRLLWDGEDAQDIEGTVIRDRVGIIFQDYLRYQLSARDNIGFGRAEALDDETRLRQAARQAGAHEFLDTLPEGYATGLGKEFLGGQDLSGGQWQRVALARAFFRAADLLILDEPTASLDARAEDDVFRQVRDLMTDKTVVLISHRFSTVRGADRIYVLDKGRIIESGTHEQLLADDGRYAELFELQAAAYR